MCRIDEPVVKSVRTFPVGEGREAYPTMDFFSVFLSRLCVSTVGRIRSSVRRIFFERSEKNGNTCLSACCHSLVGGNTVFSLMVVYLKIFLTFLINRFKMYVSYNLKEFFYARYFFKS